MPSWHERFVTQARTDATLRRDLHQLARLDSTVMANANMALTQNWQQVAQLVERLCDRVASRVVRPGEDVDEAAQWISYHCQEVARDLPASGPSIGVFLFLLLAVAVSLFVYRWYQSWILAVVVGLVVISLASWLRSLRQSSPR